MAIFAPARKLKTETTRVVRHFSESPQTSVRIVRGELEPPINPSMSRPATTAGASRTACKPAEATRLRNPNQLLRAAPAHRHQGVNIGRRLHPSNRSVVAAPCHQSCLRTISEPPPQIRPTNPPSLHEDDALVPVGGPIVDAAHHVLVLVRQDRFDHVRVEAPLIEDRARRRAEAVAGDFVRRVSHPPQRGVEGIL